MSSQYYNRNIITHTFVPSNREVNDLISFLKDRRVCIINYLYETLREKSVIRWYLKLRLRFIDLGYSIDEVKFHRAVLKSTIYTTVEKCQLRNQLSDAYAHLLDQVLGNGHINPSVGTLDQVLKLEVKVTGLNNF